MADKTVENGIELVIATVKDPLSLSGGSTVTEFTATDNKTYKTFSDSIRPYLKQGATIKVDIETTVKPGQNGQSYTNRNIVQLYANGEPVSKQKKGQWSGGGSQDSPERRLSEELQALSHGISRIEAALVQFAGVASDPFQGILDKRNKYWDALLDKGIVMAKAKPAATANASRPAPQRTVSQPPATPGTDTPPAPEKATNGDLPHTVSGIGELLAACKTHFNMTPKNVITMLMVQEVTAIEDCQNAWMVMRLLKWAQKEFGLTTAKVLNELNLSAPLEIADVKHAHQLLTSTYTPVGE